MEKEILNAECRMLNAGAALQSRANSASEFRIQNFPSAVRARAATRADDHAH